MKLPLLFLGMIIFIVYPYYAQFIDYSNNLDTIKDENIHSIAENLEKIRSNLPLEKIYLHLDNPSYLSGETVWFKGYVTSYGTGHLSTLSRILYVDLIDSAGNILLAKQIPVEEGLSPGHMDLPRDLKSGIYGIRSYTNGLKNFEERYFFYQPIKIIHYQDRNVSNTNEKPFSDFGIRFFPEGGDLVKDLSSRVAYKAMDDNGNTISLTGTVKDEQGRIVAETSTRHEGMGSFFVLPENGKNYYFEATCQGLHKRFKIPDPVPSGYTMNINTLKEEDLQILIKCSEAFSNKDAYLVGVSRGTLVFHRMITPQSQGIVILIPRISLPHGTVQFTLFDQNLTPWVERIVLLKNPADQIKIEAPEKALGKRSKVDFLIKAIDADGFPLRNVNLSVAVTDGGQILKRQEDGSILSYFLLTSELKGPVMNPGYYFKENSREVNIALDLLMMTQGWRRFTWKEIFEYKPGPYQYDFEMGFTLTGTAYLEDKKKFCENCILHILSLNDLYPGFWTTFTDHEGSFELKGLSFSDTLEVAVKAINLSGKLTNVDLEFDNKQENQKIDRKFYTGEFFALNSSYKFSEMPRYSMNADSFILNRNIVLQEIEIKGRQYYRSRYGQPDATIVVDEKDENYTDIFQLMKGKITGVQIYGNGLETRISIRGDSYPLIILDGIPLNASSSGLSMGVSGGVNTSGSSQSKPNEPVIPVASGNSSSSDANATLLSIPPADVERIDVLKTYAATSTYGMTASKGVIIIYTKKGFREFQNERSKGYEGYFIAGLDQVREFYSPNYEQNISLDEDIPDLRTTLFWEPLLVTDRNGIARITFYNSDVAQQLQVDIQGITPRGNPIYLLEWIDSERVR